MPLDAKQADWLNHVTGVAVTNPPQPGGTVLDPKQQEAENRKKLGEMLRARLEQEEFDDAQRKSLLIADAIRAIAPMKPVLQEAWDLEQTTGDGKTRTYQTDDGDLSKSADVRDIREGTEIGKRGTTGKKKKDDKSPKDPMRNLDILRQAEKAMAFLVTVRDDMQSQKTSRSTIDWSKIDLTAATLPNDPFAKGPEQRLFTDTELMDEIYTPLVREHVLPENFIINKFSKVQKMLDATNKMYKEELKDADDPGSGTSELIQGYLDMGSQLVDAVLQSAGADTKIAQDFLTGATALAKLSVSTGFKIADKGLNASIVSDVFNGLGGVVANVLAGAMPGQSDSQQTMAAVYGKIAQAGGALAGGVVTTIEKGELDQQAMVNFFGGIVQAGISDIPVDTAKGQDMNALFVDLTGAATTAVSGKIKALTDAISNNDMKTMRSVLIDMSTDFAIQSSVLINDIYQTSQATGDKSFTDMTKAETSDEIVAKYTENKFDSGYNVTDTSSGSNIGSSTSAGIANLENTMIAVGGQVKEGFANVGESNKTETEVKDKKERQKERRKLTQEEIEKLKKQLGPVAEQSFADLEKEVAKKEAKREDEKSDFDKIGKDILKDIEKEREEFQKQLKGLDNPAIDQKTISKLIAQMERDRAILQVAITIGQGGFEVASNFLAPLAIGTEAVKMVANIAAAVQRAVDLRKFLDEAAGAKAGTSPYLSSIQNFVDNQKDQLAHHAIAAALNGAKIAAAAAATAFPMAAPAVTIVGAIQSGAEALYQFNTQQQVVAAWEVTKAALDDPENRRMGLKARRMNATLAKYAVAYGAIEEKDPVAVHMANACGLDNETLKNKEANAKKVKQFLEKKFNEDPKVTGKYKKDLDWSKKLPEPALKSTALFHAYGVIAEGFAGTKQLMDVVGTNPLQPPSDLTTLLRAVEKAPLKPAKTPATEQETAERVQAMQDRLLLFGQIRGALGGEKQRLDKIDAAVGDVIADYAELVADEQQKLSIQLLQAKLEQAKQQKPRSGQTN